MDQPLDLSNKNRKDFNESKLNFKCDIKETKSNITKHVRSIKNLLPCEICKKTFDRPSLLKRHLRTHTGEKPHVCDMCNKGFSTSSSLNTHRRIHTGHKPHVCGHCGKRFTASSNLYYHRMTHTKIKPHKCTVCTKSFPTPGDLKSHMYVHNGCWPYRCPICSRGFSKQTNLKNHFMLHTGDKPHSCKFCSKRFALPCNLKAHMKLHHPEQEVQPSKLQKECNNTLQSSQLLGTEFKNNIVPDSYRLYEEFHKNAVAFRLPYISPFEHIFTFHNTP